MAFEPIVREVDARFTRTYKAENFTINMSIPVGEIKGINKVLAVGVQPYVEKVTANSGSVQIEGKLNANVLVGSENGYDNISGVFPFNQFIMNGDFVSTSNFYATAELVKVSDIIANDSNINFAVIFAITPIMLESEKIKYLEKVNDLAEQKIEQQKYSDLIANTYQSVEMSYELDLPNNISKILSVNNKTVLSQIEAGNDLISLNGQNYANLVYLTNDEVPKLKNQSYVQDFHYEILATNVVTTDNPSVNLQLCNTSWEKQGEFNSSKSTIIIKNDYKALVFVRQEKTFTAVVDCYCPKYQLKHLFNSYTIQKVLDTKFYVDKIDGAVALTDDESIDKICGICCANVVIKNYLITESRVQISGILTCNIIYKLDDEMGSIRSILVELPFLTERDCEGITELDNLHITAVAKEIEGRIKKGKEVDIIAEISMCITWVANQNGSCLVNVELGEKRGDVAPIGIYLVQSAENSWEVAKSLLVSEETLLKQNPDISFPITQPQKLVVYREKSL